MKKSLLLLIIGIALLLVVNPVMSQQTSATQKDFKFTIKTNPLAALGGPFWVVVIPVTGEYKLLFETALSKKSSFQLGAGYLGPSVLINLDNITSTDGQITGIKTSGFRVQGMYKLFISRDLNAPEGFYIGPHISYASATIKNKANATDKLAGTKLNVNFAIGYQMITTGGFTLDIFTGMGFVSRKWTVTGSNFDQSDFKPRNSVSIPFAVSIGYAF
jgi:hypothetical protein